MKLFLTSSPFGPWEGEGTPLPCRIDAGNEFLKNMKLRWKENSRCLIICADPDHYGLNDEMRETFESVFRYEGLSVTSMETCDSRNWKEAGNLLENSDMIILGGGHVPTQSEFFRKISLRERIAGFEGIIMGISAGTMNCAGTVYAQPEMPGEALDPEYERFIPGLGLTEINVLPHYQNVKDTILDGKRLFEEITYPDSIGKCFYALVDGSYILEENGKAVLFGEAYRIQDGEFEKICEKGNSLVLFRQ